jgi:hypothetical protein
MLLLLTAEKQKIQRRVAFDDIILTINFGKISVTLLKS